MAFNKPKAMQEAEKLVAHGKIQAAIKQYAFILEKEPADLTLLNTIGDLYIRDKNVPQALSHFHKLADAYTQEGFTLKAIAIYKKIIKLETTSAEPLTKLAELYVLQGLSREARDHYAQAVDFYKKKNQLDKALEIFRKIVGLDPENVTYRQRFAEFCEQAGRKNEAALAYADAAEVALRRADAAAAESALQKAVGFDPQSQRVHLLRARLASRKKDWGQVEKVLESVPALKATPEGRQLLLEAYVAGQKLEAAEKLVGEVFSASPGDFSPLASYATMCAERGDFDAAVRPLAAVADTLISREETGPLVESLRQIWAKSAQHLPTLEVLYRVYERTGEEFSLSEVMQALGRAYLEAEQLEKAEEICRKLVSRAPENEKYKNLLNDVLQKLGKEAELPTPALAGPAILEAAIPAEAGAPPAPVPAVDAEEVAMVKEALDNSDLFARYGLVDKAVAELEKALAAYPDQTDIHQRILEVCHRTQPDRSRQAAEALARIYTARGDMKKARRYEAVAGPAGVGAFAEEVTAPEAAPAEEVFPTVTAAEAPSAEIDLSSVFPVGAPQPPAAEAPPAALPVGLGAPSPPKEMAEFDLSTDLEAFAQAPEAPAAAPEVVEPPLEITEVPLEVPVAPPEAPPFNYEESRVEIDFYLDQGFIDEARQAVEALEEKFPGSREVAILRHRLESQIAPVEAAPEAPAPFEAPPQPVEAAGGEWELPTGFAGAPAVEAPPPLPVPEAPLPEPPPAAPPPVLEPEAVAAGGDLLGDLAGDLAASLEGVEAPPGAAPQPAWRPAPPAAGAGGDAASALSGLLDELGEGAGAEPAPEDLETHYNLGVAFREMNLLDEAIGEFQKVVKGAQKGKYPPNFLQACSLLAVCFMDKGMPTIAIKWYGRALEFPDLDEEAIMALQYDLGVAYEKAGDTRTALEKFSEVYAQNIDYRDVAEKIRQLQQKAH